MKPANRRDAWTVAALAGCGIVLGTVMAPLFAPLPKVPASEPLQLSGRAQAASYGKQSVWVDRGSQDLGMGQGYVPSDAYDGPIWQYPAPAYEPWEPEATEAREETEMADSGAWQAADEAEAAAKDAAAAAAAAAAQQPETVRKSELANGLY